jgi:hypothetical protein
LQRKRDLSVAPKWKEAVRLRVTFGGFTWKTVFGARVSELPMQAPVLAATVLLGVRLAVSNASTRMLYVVWQLRASSRVDVVNGPTRSSLVAPL